MVTFRRAGFLLTPCIACAIAAVLLWHHYRSWEYGLPVELGASSASVHRVLGLPSFSFPDSGNAKRTNSTFLTHGIIGTFEDDQLMAIMVPNESPNGAQVSTRDYQQGFLIYSGVIIRGLRISDNKQKILNALGKPTKIESDDLPAGTNPDAPVVWPKQSGYYWRLPDYVIEVDFLDQAQLVDDEKHLTLPKDSVIAFQIRK